MTKTPKKKTSKTAQGTQGGESFEVQLEQLEKLVGRLEGGDLPLEETLASFELGISLTRTLMKRLDDAEKRIEVLLEKSAGEIKAREITAEELERAATRGGLSDEDEEEEEENE